MIVYRVVLVKPCLMVMGQAIQFIVFAMITELLHLLVADFQFYFPDIIITVLFDICFGLLFMTFVIIRFVGACC